MNKRFKKIPKTVFIFTLVFSWVFSGWPQILDFEFRDKNLKFPQETKQAKAETTNILPNAKHASDTTDDNLSGVTADDAATADYAISGVNASDNVYTADKGDIMQIDTFDVSSIPDTSTISAVVLHLQWGAEDSYGGTSPVRYDNGSGLTTTGITPSDTKEWSADETYDLYAQGVNTRSEILNVDIEFTNNDGAGPDAINFDYIWITVTYTPPANSAPSLTVSQPDGTGDKVTVGDSYNITYDLSDSDDAATVDFYYDSDNIGLNGTAITGCQDQAEGTGATCSWNTTGMTAGSYYVYGIATDGVNPNVNDYSPGQITIFSTTIEVRAQDYLTAVTSITFPAGDPSAVISNPTNSASETQVFGTATNAHPVVTLYNGGSGALTIWYNVTTFTNSVVSTEHYLVNAKAAACLNADAVTNAVTFDTDTTTGVSITNGAGNEKDFYLKVTIGAVYGKSSTSTLTILGEAP